MRHRLAPLAWRLARWLTPAKTPSYEVVRVGEVKVTYAQTPTSWKVVRS